MQGVKQSVLIKIHSLSCLTAVQCSKTDQLLYVFTSSKWLLDLMRAVPPLPRATQSLLSNLIGQIPFERANSDRVC